MRQLVRYCMNWCPNQNLVTFEVMNGLASHEIIIWSLERDFRSIVETLRSDPYAHQTLTRHLYVRLTSIDLEAEDIECGVTGCTDCKLLRALKLMLAAPDWRRIR